MIFNPLGCCGIKEIQGLSSWPNYPDDFFHAIRDHNGSMPCAWVCFNGVRTGGYVSSFARFLEKEKLGPVISLPDIVNPNSNNMLDVRMWQVDHTALRAWYQRHLDARKVCDCYTCRSRRTQEVLVAQRLAQQAALAAATQPGQSPAPTPTPYYRVESPF